MARQPRRILARGHGALRPRRNAPHRLVEVPVTLGSDIDALLAKFVTPEGPGAAIGVVRDSVFVHRKAYGLADLEWQTPLRPDCVFRIASLTKPFVATAAMMLAERGALSLDDPLERHLRWWPDRGRRVTIGRLLNHTS